MFVEGAIASVTAQWIILSSGERSYYHNLMLGSSSNKWEPYLQHAELLYVEKVIFLSPLITFSADIVALCIIILARFPGYDG